MSPCLQALPTAQWKVAGNNNGLSRVFGDVMRDGARHSNNAYWHGIYLIWVQYENWYQATHKHLRMKKACIRFEPLAFLVCFSGVHQYWILSTRKQMSTERSVVKLNVEVFKKPHLSINVSQNKHRVGGHEPDSIVPNIRLGRCNGNRPLRPRTGPREDRGHLRSRSRWPGNASQ